MLDVIIPCVPAHAKHLPDVLRSIRQNTMAPDHVIVALSETPDAKCVAMRDTLQRALGDDIPLRMTCTEARANASQNRNRGARLSTADLLMFFDADDLMLRGRIAALVAALRAEGADAVLHAFTRDPTYVESGSEVSAPLLANDYPAGTLAHGHGTYTRASFWEMGGYPESLALAEDTTLKHRYLSAGKRVVVVPRKLSLYRQHLSNDFRSRLRVWCRENGRVLVVLLILIAMVAFVVVRY